MTDGPDPNAGGASQYVDTEGVYDRVAERLGRASNWALSPHEAGLGNETLFLVWGARQFVFRRPPLDSLATASHDIVREYRALDALDWTDVPTPRPILAEFDDSVAGAPFTVQERLTGDVLRHGEPVGYAASTHRRRVGEELVDTLATIHDVDTDELAGVDLPRESTAAEHVSTLHDRFEQYHAATDHNISFEGNNFYRALGVYEQAVVCEGYYARHVRGSSDRPVFADLGDAVQALLDRAGSILDGEDPL